MKKLLSILLLSVALSTRAQLLGEFSTMQITNFYITPTLSASATYSYAGTNVVDVARYHNVGWSLSFAGESATTANVIITFERTHDGTNWETAPLYTWTVPANGTAIVRAMTNFATAPALYWRPKSITNAGSVNLTNAVLVGIRRSAIVD